MNSFAYCGNLIFVSPLVFAANEIFKVLARAIVRCGLRELLIALAFDTTPANTGVIKGNIMNEIFLNCYG